MITATMCRFRREKESPSEVGVIVKAGRNEVIVDQLGAVVPAPLWGYWEIYEAGHAVFDPKTVGR